MNVREWALPVYTILIQLATGSLFFLWIVRFLNPSDETQEKIEELSSNPAFVILITIAVAMIGSHFHLSKPYFSFLAMLNLGSSWLSREIVFTILFFLTVFLIVFLQTDSSHRFYKLITLLGVFAIIFSFSTVYCMARVYLLPTQASWNTNLTILSFLGTTLLLGLTGLALMLILDLKLMEIQHLDKFIERARIIERLLPMFTITTAVISVVMLITNYLQIFYLDLGGETAKISLQLLVEIYLILLGLRYIFVLIGVGWLLISINQLRKRVKTVSDLIVPVYSSSLLILIAEILGRFLFYATHVRLGL